MIESYARELPRRKRADVAAYLHSLLTEELAGDDEAAALAIVRRFGRPGDVAARYQTPITVVDPSDTRGFVLPAAVGAMLIPSTNRRLPFSIDPDKAQLRVLAASGALVILFALKG